MRRSPLALLVLTAATGTLLGCSATPEAAPLPSTEPPPTTAPPLAAPSTAATATATATAASAAAAADAFARACSDRVLLPLMKRRFDNTAKELIIERVDVRRCRNQYAHVFAITRKNPPGHPQYEGSEQVFLHYVGGEWQSVMEGTGLSCTDTDIRPALLTACKALGYRT